MRDDYPGYLDQHCANEVKKVLSQIHTDHRVPKRDQDGALAAEMSVRPGMSSGEREYVRKFLDRVVPTLPDEGMRSRAAWVTRFLY